MEFAKKHYLVRDRHGHLKQFPFFYDQTADAISGFPQPFSIFAGLVIAHYVIAQNREFGTYLYEEAVHKLGWDNPKKPVVSVMIDPRFLTTALICARELGDDTTERRLSDYAEEHFEPRWFDDGFAKAESPENGAFDRFGWWFGLPEKYPRGQDSALMMLGGEIEKGSWSRPFLKPNLEKFDEPTVEGIDYPRLGVVRAWNDPKEGVLHLETCVQTASHRGDSTSFRVTRLPDAAAVRVWCDGEDFSAWRALSGDTIEIESAVAAHEFRIETRADRKGQSSSGEAAASLNERGRARGAASRNGEASGTAANERRYAPRPGVAAATACPGCRPGGFT